MTASVVAQHRQGTHICQRGPRLHTCEALKIGLECVKSLKSRLLPLLFFLQTHTVPNQAHSSDSNAVCVLEHGPAC